MNYKNLSFDELRELASTNPQEFKKIPSEHLRKVAIEHDIEEGKKKVNILMIPEFISVMNKQYYFFSLY